MSVVAGMLDVMGEGSWARSRIEGEGGMKRKEDRTMRAFCTLDELHTSEEQRLTHKLSKTNAFPSQQVLAEARAVRSPAE